MENVLVLGATGNIGSKLVRDLLKQQTEVRAGAPASELSKICDTDLVMLNVDFDEPQTLDQAMANVYAVFMLLPLDERMEGWAKNILEAAKRQKVQFILRSSCAWAHPESTDLLFRTHGQIDEMVRQRGIPYCITHPNVFMQNFSTYMAPMINDEGKIYSTMDRRTRISYIDVRDIAAVNAAILKNPLMHRGLEYTLNGPEALTLEDICATITVVTNRKVIYSPLTEKHFIHEQRKKGIPDWHTEVILSLNRTADAGQLDKITDDVFRLTQVPLVSFTRFTKDYSHVWRPAPAGRVGMRNG
jgi:uncharacterized protein YbjT (DUF2867 family)